MRSKRNVLDHELFEKVNRILKQQANGQEQESLTPKEFLLYIILHQKAGEHYVQLSRSALSKKVNGREGYINEVLSDKDQRGIPTLLGYQLAAMTEKPPAFFFKESYGIEEAEGVKINMEVDITAVTRAMGRGAVLGPQSQGPPRW
jgi:hypothetical protein